MTFQTNDKKDNNRDLKNKKDLKNEIRTVWQPLVDALRNIDGTNDILF